MKIVGLFCACWFDPEKKGWRLLAGEWLKYRASNLLSITGGIGLRSQYVAIK
jgi:hypothetical protein